jgi:hypothetical protein
VGPQPPRVAGPDGEESPEGDGTDDRSLAEDLSLAAKTSEGNVQRACRRAGRLALAWPEEVRDLVAAGRSPADDLPGGGPFLEVRILDLAIAAVRAAGIPPERVLNLRPAEEVVAWARALRRQL